MFKISAYNLSFNKLCFSPRIRVSCYPCNKKFSNRPIIAISIINKKSQYGGAYDRE